MAVRTDDATVTVALLALPESTPAALYGLHEVFSGVGVLWRELTGEAAPSRRMRPRIVSADGCSFASPVGPPIVPETSLATADPADVVIAGDLVLAPGEDPRGRWQREAEWIRERYAAGAVVCSVCTGSVFLAEAGLLDGADATTHWAAVDIFRRCYPQVALRPERILCPAGADGRLVTGGGSASWEDLTLHLIARFCGAQEAVRAAKVFLLGDRGEGQLPFAMLAMPRHHDDAAIAACQRWIADHYALANPVGRMAARSGLAERTFKRRFKAATGLAPVDYVQALRIEEAKQLLETTAEPTDAVAQAVGYEDPAFFRRLFRRLTGITPAHYRRRFQGVGQGS